MAGRLAYLILGKPGYCSMCGKQLERHEKPDKFNSKTGKLEKISIQIRCPDFRWVVLGTYLFGDGQITEPNGHTHFYWEERHG